MKRPTPSSLRRILYLRRRPLAALCAFGAVLAALLALSPPPSVTVPVLAARSQVAAGTVLTAEHLTTVMLPPSAVPDGAFTTESDAVGRAVGASLTARSVLTSAAMADGMRVARPGHVVAALPLPNSGIAALVRPGAVVDVLDGAGETVARGVRVLEPPTAPGEGGLFGAGASGSVALVEVTPEVAAKIATHGGSGLVVVVH